MKPPLRPADPFTAVRPRPAESVGAHQTTAEDLRRVGARTTPVRVTAGDPPPLTGQTVETPAPQTAKDRALDLVGREGMGYAEAARRLKCPHPTVYYWCKKAGVTPGSRRTEPLPPKPTAKEQRQQEQQEAREARPVTLAQGEEVLQRMMAPGARPAPPTQAEAAAGAAVIAGKARDAEAALGRFLDSIPEADAEHPALPMPAAVPPAPGWASVSEPAPPPRPPEQHWEVYVGPPRESRTAARVHDLERLLEWLHGRLVDLPAHLPSITDKAIRVALHEIQARIGQALAGGAP